MIQEAGVAGQTSRSTATTRSRPKRHRVPRRRARADRVQAPAADRRRRGLLPDDRQPEDEGPGRLRQLVPGLPAPGQLHVPRRPGSIQDTNNQNFGNVDDPKINSMLAEANKKDIERGRARLRRARQAARRATATSSPTATASCRSSARTAWTSDRRCSTRCCRPTTRRSPSRASDVTDGGGTAARPPLSAPTP